MAVELANSLWTPSHLHLSETHRDAMRGRFRAELGQLDFSSAGSARQINDWVARATRGTITHVVDSIGTETILLLVNAAYFRGLWRSPFDWDETVDHEFTLC